MSEPDRLARLSAGTLLNAQAETERGVQAAVDAVSAEAAAEAERQRRAAFRRKVALLGVVLLFSKRMGSAAGQALLAGRQDARERAAHRVLAEFSAAGILVGATTLGGTRPLIAEARRHRLDEDDLHAHAAGESLASQWRSSIVHAISRATRNDQDPVAAMREASASLAPRVRRTAVTETSQAYSDEHREAVRDAARYDNALAEKLAELGMQRRWVAMLDSCRICWPHDGETVPIFDGFSGGDEPGHVHVHCACCEIYVTAEAAALAA